jgi:hypothetical protein
MESELHIKEFEFESVPMSSTWIVIGSPGTGKCERFGQKVIMFDGKIETVENVKIGDVLMGDDSTPRIVTKLFRGRDKMYKIQPLDGTEPYWVTGKHTLCLKYNTRPQVKVENGRWPRARVVYPVIKIREDGTTEVKVTNSNFSFGKYTEKCALEHAYELKNSLTKEFDKNPPVHEIEVEKYLKQSKSFNHRLVAYRTGVDFPKTNTKLELNPYLLGAWLGDGTSMETTITNIDPELIDFLYKEAERMDMSITRGKDTDTSQGSIKYRFVSKNSRKKGCNPFMNFLRKNDLWNNKHIPQQYKVASRNDRLALLAGLIDTDGHYGNESFYEIYQKNATLADDIVFLARSLGFWCHTKPVNKGCKYKGEMKMGTYQKITFGGHNLHQLPILIPRKMACMRLGNLLQDLMHYKFTITECEEDDYYGFELSGNNHRFLLGDFTVTHNCLSPGTPVMMFNKLIKNVEDIVPGDKLMGDDEKQRDVLSVCSGEDEMYTIQQSCAEDYTVNKPHILVLKNKETDVIEEITVEDYLKVENKNRYRGYKLTKIGTTIESDITVIHKGTGKYHGFQIDGNGRFLLGDGTVTHNTTFMENICYYLKHRYAVGRIFMGTETGYQKFCDIFGPLYVSNYYDEEQEKSHILRQRTCILENGKDDPSTYAINILDDVSDDPRIYKTKVMKGLFKLGSQHWNQLFMIGSQYAIDMPPDIRKAASFIVMFREPEEIERKKLYDNFGGLAGSYKDFCFLMDEICKDFTCIIFKKRSQSNNKEDCIFWYKTKVLEPWKFGCNEAREWQKNRYNANYVEQIRL